MTGNVKILVVGNKTGLLILKVGFFEKEKVTVRNSAKFLNLVDKCFTYF